MKTAELVKALLDVDEEVFLLHGEINPHPTVVIVGGAAFLLRDLTTRNVTHDIDVFVADSVVRQVMASYPNINGAVSSYADQIPYNFEDRLVPINIPCRTIDYMTPCTEDLAVMKLYASRPNDIQDIGGAAQRGLIDWGFLRNLSTTITKLLHRLFLRIDTKSWFISMSSSRESGGGNESYIQRFPPRILSRIDWTANG